ncbi:hypothetical protein ANO11243_074500 [Dothideomycetidae sp. 11243]|nr:hypothetical protein ANO11243_074500 [fungal sp. No.11243]
MAKIFITGSTDGIGLLAAQRLAKSGHKVYLHARSAQRAEQAKTLVPQAAGVLVGDLSSLSATHKLAAEANAAGPWDAVVHNAGIGFSTGTSARTDDGMGAIFQVNSLAPYVLTALMHKPKRLLYMSSGMHRSSDTSLHDVAWRERGDIDAMQAYCDSKMHNVLLAFAVARRWAEVNVCSMEPGWVKTKAGGEAAPGDADLPGRVLADWAAGSLGLASSSGFHMNCEGKKDPIPETLDEGKQDEIMALYKELSGVDMP